MKICFFILIIAILFSLGVYAQSYLTISPTQPLIKTETKQQTIKQVESQPESIIISCNCSKRGYGCFPGSQFCIMACHAYCHHVAVISNKEFNSTTVAFYIEQPGKVSLKIYDITGRLIKTLSESNFEDGQNEMTWDNTDDNGSDVNEGAYILCMLTNEFSQTEKLILTK